MVRYYKKKFSSRLGEVPKEGEIVSLVEIGTHARGSIFTDKRDHITAELTKTIDHISKKARGVYCGRYDLRVPSLANLKAGKNISIIEFNGVTGEPAHIYHPKYPLYKGLADIFSQWKFIYKAGAQNRARGYTPSSYKELIEVIKEHRRKKWVEADELI